MNVRSRVQIHQYNDPEILEFFNEQHVEYRLVGDHLFIIRSRGRDMAAGPGDWLTAAGDGEVRVQRGDYARRAQRAIERARLASPERRVGFAATEMRDAKARATEVCGGSAEQVLTEVPESETERWKRRVEAETRDRLRRHIRHVAQED